MSQDSVPVLRVSAPVNLTAIEKRLVLYIRSYWRMVNRLVSQLCIEQVVFRVGMLNGGFGLVEIGVRVGERVVTRLE